MGSNCIVVRLLDIVFTELQAYLIFDNFEQTRFLLPVSKTDAESILDIYHRQITKVHNTCTLLCNCVTVLHGSINKVILEYNLSNNHTSAHIVIENNNHKSVKIHAQAVDAISIALLHDVPMYFDKYTFSQVQQLSLLEEAKLLIQTTNVYSICEK